MKSVFNIKSLFEDFEITAAAKARPDDITIAQWPYRYTWPQKQVELGDFPAIVKEIEAATKGDAKQLLDTIKLPANAGAQIGIARNQEQQDRTRLLGKDTSSIVGWIYLFNPNTFDETLIPDLKKITPGIDGKFTFKFDADFKKYLKKVSKSGTTQQQQQQQPAKKYKLSNIVQPGPINDWYGKDLSVIINQTSTRIQNVSKPIDVKIPTGAVDSDGKPVEITQKMDPGRLNVPSAASPIFWEFVSLLPHGLSTPPPPLAKQTEHTQELKEAIDKLLDEARKIDQTGISLANSSYLDENLYVIMAQALLLIGLNRGDIDTTLSLTDAATSKKDQQYYTPIQKAAEKSKQVEQVQATQSQTSSYSGNTVSSEEDLAKIISGAFITKYGASGNQIDTKAKIIDAINATAKQGNWLHGDQFWQKSIVSLPWEKNKNATAEMKQIRTFCGLNDRNAPYGPSTAALFQKMYLASSY